MKNPAWRHGDALAGFSGPGTGRGIVGAAETTRLALWRSVGNVRSGRARTSGVPSLDTSRSFAPFNFLHRTR
jgi:hypothetical protein